MSKDGLSASHSYGRPKHEEGGHGAPPPNDNGNPRLLGTQEPRDGSKRINAYEYASSCSVYQTFRMSLTGQTHYLLLTATVFAIFPSRSGYIDQSGNPARHHRTCQTLSPPSQGV